MFIGSKEVEVIIFDVKIYFLITYSTGNFYSQVIDLVNKENTVVKKTAENVSSSDSIKRPTKRLKTSISSLHKVDDIDALVLPKPDLSHQVIRNINLT